MHARRMIITYALLLGFAGLVVGCAPLTAPATSNVLPATSKAFDVPGDVDPSVIMRVLGDSFLHVLKAPPTVLEGAMPRQMPLVPSSFFVEHKVLTLDHLGTVRFPHVVCPRALVRIEGIHDTLQAVSRYTACLQPFRDGYRVHLVETPAALHQDDPTPSLSVLPSDVLMHLADRVSNGLPQAKVASALQGATAVESEEVYQEVLTRTQDSVDSARQTPSLGTVQSHEAEPEIGAISPLVCLGLERKEVVVRATPGDGRVIGTLTSELALGENTPLDGVYIRVRTDQGLAGWVEKRDLHWSSCPIG